MKAMSFREFLLALKKECEDSEDEFGLVRYTLLRLQFFWVVSQLLPPDKHPTPREFINALEVLLYFSEGEQEPWTVFRREVWCYIIDRSSNLVMDTVSAIGYLDRCLELWREGFSAFDRLSTSRRLSKYGHIMQHLHSEAGILFQARYDLERTQAPL